MKVGVVSAIVMGLALCGAALAQEANPAPAPAPQPGSPPAGWHGHHPGGAGGMGMRGLEGTVTEAAADHFVMKTEGGEVYTVRLSANTRFVNPPPMHRMGGEPPGAGNSGMVRAEPLKPSDIKAGEAIAVIGQEDPDAKTVVAEVVIKVDPEREKMMREMHANYGKTWLQGKVTGVDGVKVTLMGMMDHANHTFVADENTEFRMHRQPITLADIHVGDMVRAEGAIKNGNFVATRVMVMRMSQHMTTIVPRGDTTPSEQAPPPPQ